MSTPTQNMTSKNTPAFSDPANTWNQRFAAPGFPFGAEPNGWLREHAVCEVARLRLRHLQVRRHAQRLFDDCRRFAFRETFVGE